MLWKIHFFPWHLALVWKRLLGRLGTLGVLLFMVGCGFSSASPVPRPSLSPSPSISPTPAVATSTVPAPSDTATPAPLIWAWSPRMPMAAETGWASPPGWRAGSPQEATVLWDWATSPDDVPLATWRYALVAPFFSLSQGGTLDDLRDFWQGRDPSWRPPELWASPETVQALSVFWGPPAPERIHQAAASALLERTWPHQAWALVPFEQLRPQWKVLPLDGHFPWDPDYPLALPLTARVQYPLGAVTPPKPPSNFDPQRLTVVALTGVTALVRATAYTMEIKGITYPAEEIGSLLASADITHISNEIPFDPSCPPPDPNQKDLKFCSDPRYIALLEAVGTDVVELTGDHFNDRGPEAVYFTVNMYRERGWAYYGGGENLDDARRPALFEHHGNRIAFVGCNAKGGGYAKAAPDYPGAAACEWDALTAQVHDLRAEGYLPIVTFQHQEYYLFDPPDSMKEDFRRMADAGAVIVSGSQAHHPHGIEFYHGALLTYGLGNLFFDQKGVTPYGDQALIALHYFYANQHISTRLVPIYFVDFAKPVFMSPEEARPLLEQIFAVSQGP